VASHGHSCNSNVTQGRVLLYKCVLVFYLLSKRDSPYEIFLLNAQCKWIHKYKMTRKNNM